MNKTIFTFILSSIVVVSSLLAQAGTEKSEPQLTITAGTQRVVFTRSQLLKLPSVQNVVIEKDPVYNNARKTYTAVPLTALFEKIKKDAKATLLFNCLDGFSAPLSIERALEQKKDASQAYVAIELADQAWPARSNKSKDSAGPFYLVWTNPEKSKIGPEEWPFQLSGFEIVPPLETQYPNVVPKADVSATSVVQSGFKLFVKNCFSCHRVNGEGPSELAPDLNIPHNPTEYFKLQYLKTLIRNPQNLRHWSGSRMKGFEEKLLNDTELNQILEYLKYISKHKKISQN